MDFLVFFSAKNYPCKRFEPIKVKKVTSKKICFKQSVQVVQPQIDFLIKHTIRPQQWSIFQGDGMVNVFF